MVAQRIKPAPSSTLSSGPSQFSTAIFAVEPVKEMRWARVVVITLAGVVSHTFGRSTMPLLLPAIAEDLGLSATTAGATGSVNMAAYLCSDLPRKSGSTRCSVEMWIMDCCSRFAMPRHRAYHQPSNGWHGPSRSRRSRNLVDNASYSNI